MSGPVPGHSFAGYDVVRMLGKGGMGSVYLVGNPHLGRSEALKVLAVDAEGSFAQRFAAEARTVASLDHPGIVTVYHHGIADGVPWFTMQYLDGTDLSGKVLPLPQVQTIVTQVAAALDYAHARNVVHRDIKPANLMVSRDVSGAIERVTILDFGIARLSGSTSLTGVDSFIGTLTYSAPESITGQRDNPASDQYALACTAYELLTGRPPLHGLPAAALLNAQLSTPPPLIGSVAPQYAHLDGVFARALAKDPAQRYPSCRAFAEALSGAGHRATQLAPRPVTGPATRPRTTAPHSSTSATSTSQRGSRSTMTIALSVITILIGLGVIATVVVLGQKQDGAAASSGPVWGLVVSPEGSVLTYGDQPDEAALLSAAAGQGFSEGDWGRAVFTSGCAAVAHSAGDGGTYFLAHAADRAAASSDAVAKAEQSTGEASTEVAAFCVGDPADHY